MYDQMMMGWRFVDSAEKAIEIWLHVSSHISAACICIYSQRTVYLENSDASSEDPEKNNDLRFFFSIVDLILLHIVNVNILIDVNAILCNFSFLPLVFVFALVSMFSDEQFS